MWNNTFSNTPAENTKLIVGTRNLPNATTELVLKRLPLQPTSKKQKHQTN
jgi:hypothetical protein